MGRNNPALFSWRSITGTTIAVFLLIGGAAILLRHLRAQERVVLLCPDGNAKWIRADEPFDVAAKRIASTRTVFATTIRISSAPMPATLQVTALRRVVIRLDGQRIFDSGPDLSKWKTVCNVPIPAGVSAGSHQLRCTVSNEMGPAMLRLRCSPLGVATGADWQASTDQLHWKPAAVAGGNWEPAVTEAVDPHRRDMLPIALCAVALFAICLAAAVRKYRSSGEMRASLIRWLLLAAWVVLSLNNLFKIPIACGYDAQSHYQYILFVADHLSLPNPDAGWQFFQAPFYYMVSAGFCRMLIAAGLAHDTILILLRLIPLACGGLLIEICYRAARIVYPARGGLQIIATVVGGLMPVNLYMAQTVSNEPLAAVFSGIIFLILLRWLSESQRAPSSKSLAIAGMFLGLAWLTKINTLLWIVPVVSVLVMVVKRNSKKTPVLSYTKEPGGPPPDSGLLGTSEPALRMNLQWLKALAIIAACAIVISGPYILRNLWLSGRPVYVEYPVSAAQWWQDPGYRTPRSFYEFGHVFSRPIYNGIESVWDSLYGTLFGKGIPSGREPWNFRFMWCGLWLGILPCILIILGMIRAAFFRIGPHLRDSLRIAALTIGCFIAAVLYVYLRLPIFSCAKASYMLGTIPCMGLLAAAGCDCIPPNRWLRAAIGGAIGCWAAVAYFTFLAI